MIRCNGSCSDGRANPAKRTRAGETGPSAPLEKDCCAVFANSVVRSTTMPSPSYERSLSSILIGSKVDDPCKPSTFTRRPRTRPS